MTQPPEDLVSSFYATVARHPHTVAMRSSDGLVSWTWEEYAARAERLASGLHGLGVRPGDTVALLMGNRPEWQLSDLAALMVGATPFSLYITAPPAKSMTLARRAGARVLIADPSLLNRHAVPDEMTVVLTEPDGSGRAVLNQLPADADYVAPTLAPDDLATLIFTSGTTGSPKAVELTHAAIVFIAWAMNDVVPLDGGRTLSYLPHAHIVDRVVGHYLGLVAGATVTTVPSPAILAEVLVDTRPTIFTSVPRIWQRIESTLRRHMEDGVPLAALPATIGLDQAQWLITGSAPLPRGSHEFFASVGLPLHDLWGLSETVAIATLTVPGDHHIGTVGRPVPGTEIRLADDGEVHVRGPHLFRGYRDDPAATADAIAPDGWFHTGDVGVLRDGLLSIIDRKKELIISSGGENMAPSRIEGILVDSSPLVAQAIVVGDARPFNVAVLVPDFEELTRLGIAGRPTDLVRDNRVRALFDEVVNDANEQLSRAERIHRHALTETAFTSEGGELTPTLKLRRRATETKYAAAIASLYDE